ncbi:Cytochrome P450 momooxygenase gsfF [Talaromyces pinophilus]|nr:Cytochrome P450 momooxygenase gsfF [Talaromyces pinophilus]
MPFDPSSLSFESLNSFSVITVGLLTTVVILVILPFRDPLASVPGPFWARWSPAWMVYHALKGDMHREMIQLHDKYGSIVRTGPYEVSIADPDAIQLIYGAGASCKKSDWYSVWQGRRKFDLFAERDANVHSTNRRFVNSIYSFSGLLEFEPYLDNVLSVFLSRLSQMDTQRIDMGYWAQLFAFDVIGELTFSKRFGFIDEGTDKGTFVHIDGALQSAAWIGQVPWLYWVHDWLSPWIGNHLKITNRHGLLREISAREVSQRNSVPSSHPDMLDKFMDVHRNHPGQFDIAAVMSMAASNIFAGSDTTAISIGAILYYLCKYPQHKEKLMEEIFAEADAGRIGRTNVPYKVARDMPYLQACIQEGLRCHPAVGMSLPRVVPPGGLAVNGVHIPGGIVAGTNPWVIHRNKEIFGDDADVFRPDRCVQELSSATERFSFAFGAGSRTCIGKSLSLLEISKLLPCLLLEYDIEFADPTAQIEENCW